MKQIPRDWHMLDYSKDSIYGISANRAYDELLKGKTSQKVIVAVVDAGADTLQEDLKNVIWHNPKEIPGDGIDNDKDGYTDDYYGWNFIGGKSDTSNVTKDSYIVDRVYFRYKSLFENVKDIKEVKKKDLYNYKEWLRAKELELKTQSPQAKEAADLQRITDLLPQIEDFKKTLVKDTFTLDDVKAYEPLDRRTSAEKQIYTILFQRVAANTNNYELPAALNKLIDSLKNASVLPTTPPIDYRGNVVKDDYNDFNDKYYGNANISAGDVMHGTHVSGIIGAERNNGVGIDGIADNVALMELRAVPDGDEHDKDIAEAIRFAVDHGAKVINMSFGKPLSPQRKWVEDAFRYAQQHDVLLVHAAGNDGEDLMENPNYPTQYFEKDTAKSFDNMITVGASGPIEPLLVAEFSNFNAQAVDVFAPGLQIYSTLPGKSEYGPLSGTSMASPVVAGIAAVLRSYFSSLTAPQVKQIIMQSVTPIDFPVVNPATGKQVSMKSLCVTGGIVNLYNAVKLAEQETKK
ncbi:hypothetical protein A9P82_09320 [Arachidicoccus ginsenosidimutans]|nr:hypothetical protein A9P82_09320 [Arachidicoccus sp. BS20]